MLLNYPLHLFLQICIPLMLLTVFSFRTNIVKEVTSSLRHMTDLLSVITEYFPFLESCMFLSTSKGQSSFKIVQDQTIYICKSMDFRQMQPVTSRCKQIGNSYMPIINAIKLEIGNVPFSD